MPISSVNHPRETPADGVRRAAKPFFGAARDRFRHAISRAGRSSFLLITDFEAFRRQESSLILLNLGILAALVLDQVLFLPVVGAPPRILLVLFAARFVEQTLEFLWLQGRTNPLSPPVTLWYSRLSVWAHLAFAFIVSLVGRSEDTHYWVLMILPIVAAAFRFGWAGTLGVALGGGALSFFHVWFFYHGHSTVFSSEYFEASIMVLLLLVVAGVVWLLGSYLRAEEIRLRESLLALEAAQKELVAKEKMAAVGRLASAIAHEIRNPVAMIVSSVAMARKEGIDCERKQQICDILFKEGRRLERLSGDFLAYASSREPDRRWTSVRTTLDYVASLAKAQGEGRGTPIRIDCPGDFEGFFDPFQIHQALLNLVINALDAAPEGGEIVLRAAQENGGGLHVEVDNAVLVPVPETVRAQLFEPFFTTKCGGTGLGLCIARNIARAHQGNVELSRNEDGHVVFALTISGESGIRNKG